ncbi:hypothetical protein JCM10207_008112 [Rhodosporidiobolus poonsookiae]
MSHQHGHGHPHDSQRASDTTHPDPLRSHPPSGPTAFDRVARDGVDPAEPPSLRKQFEAGAWRPSHGGQAQSSTTTSARPVIFRSAEPSSSSSKSFADRAKEQGFRRP